MTVLLWMILGGLIGGLASMLNDRSEAGVNLNVFLGISGSLFGGWLVTLFGHGYVMVSEISTFLFAVFGAIALIIIFSGFKHPLQRA